ELVAGLAALLGLLVEEGGLLGGAARLRQATHDEVLLVGRAADHDHLAHLHEARALGPGAADVDLAAVDGGPGPGARPAEAGGPQPLVEADARSWLLGFRFGRHARGLHWYFSRGIAASTMRTPSRRSSCACSSS